MISSPRNTHVQQARKLSKRGVRDRLREFLVEGATGVLEAIETRSGVHTLFLEPDNPRASQIRDAARAARVTVLDVSGSIMKLISGATTPPGVVAVCGFVDVAAADLLRKPLSTAVVLADVRDPGNVGTILRTAWAVGADAVFLGEGCVDIYNAKVVRATAGALFDVPVARDVDVPWLLEELGERGVKRVAAEPRAGARYDEVDMREPTALVLGNEAWGLPADIAGAVDVAASIPLAGRAESLNVGVAAALFMFEIVRQRKGP